MNNCTHVIFVHGTFSSPRIWDQACEALVNDPTVIRTTKFKWSGANDQRERLSAASGLAEIIIQCKEKNPREKICLVGHSHGGNVCFHAIDALPSPQLVDKVVSMGTPFFCAKPRQIGIFIDAFYFLFATFFALLIPAALIWMATEIFSLTKNEYVFLSLIAIFGLIILPSYSWYLINGEGAMEDFVNAQHSRLRKLVSPQYNFNISSLCLVVERDEALVGLTILGKLSGIGTSLAVVHSQAVQVALNIASSNILILIFAMFIFPFLFPSLFVLANVSMFGYVTAVAMQSLFRSHRLGFGDLGIWPLMLFNVHVCPAPPLIVPAELRSIAPENIGLRHSYFYRDPQVISDMVQWIADDRPLEAPPEISEEASKLSLYLGFIYVILCVLGVPLLGLILTVHYIGPLLETAVHYVRQIVVR